jgi:hypothetical protein
VASSSSGEGALYSIDSPSSSLTRLVMTLPELASLSPIIKTLRQVQEMRHEDAERGECNARQRQQP